MAAQIAEMSTAEDGKLARLDEHHYNYVG